MVYTDGTHIIADSVEELHDYCQSVGIRRCWFEGTKRGHPHYDIPKYKRGIIIKEIDDWDKRNPTDRSGRRIKKIRPRQILLIIRNEYTIDEQGEPIAEQEMVIGKDGKEQSNKKG